MINLRAVRLEAHDRHRRRRWSLELRPGHINLLVGSFFVVEQTVSALSCRLLDHRLTRSNSLVLAPGESHRPHRGQPWKFQMV